MRCGLRNPIAGVEMRRRSVSILVQRGRSAPDVEALGSSEIGNRNANSKRFRRNGRPKFGRPRASIGRVRPPIRSNSAKIRPAADPPSADVGRCCPNIGRSRPRSAHIGPNLVAPGPNSAEFRTNRSPSAKCKPKKRDFWQPLAGVARRKPQIGQVWPTPDQIWPMSLELAQISEFGQIRRRLILATRAGRIWSPKGAAHM